MKMEDLTGQKFGMLTVIRFSHRIETNYFWECRCDCGTIKNIRRASLKQGYNKSCGCWIAADRLTRTPPSRKQHGLQYHPLYQKWDGMKRRCFDIDNKGYKDYGGRGITMCDEWKNDFITFYNWGIANGYKEGLVIDRINNNGNYEPDNCRFVTTKINNNNTRSNRLITYKGETKTLAQWAESIGLKKTTLHMRFKYGWDIESGLNKPVSYGK